VAETGAHSKLEDVFPAIAFEPMAHEFGGWSGQNYFLVGANVVAMGVTDKDPLRAKAARMGVEPES
jgi:hypothetical protein